VNAALKPKQQETDFRAIVFVLPIFERPSFSLFETVA
jgi:hypothetical protein